MSDYYFIVQTNAVPGHEQEFSNWYSDEHLDDALAVQGIVAARRFELAGVRTMPEGLQAPFRFLTIYEIDGDFHDAFDALNKARERWHLSEFMAEERLACVYRPVGDRRTARA